ncbi:hypothetical protein D5b_00152 [Faustovirus]|nr:hypothetical protein D5b_00152 [Faustovirus]AMN84759.1 hypothetical protein D6_00359 [Faustovirus]AMP44109.1 hypothetical protein PRJ_Dakar_00150 [Faustovirus]
MLKIEKIYYFDYIAMNHDNILDIPAEIIINHVLNIDIFAPLMLTCRVLYTIVNKFIECGDKVIDAKYTKILQNSLLKNIQIGNTRAISALLKVPCLGHMRRDEMTICTLFKECCGLAYQEAKYQRALRLINTYDIDTSKYIYSILVWCAKSQKQDLFDAALEHTYDKKQLTDHFQDLLNVFLGLESEYYAVKFLDYVKIRDISNVWWCSAHVNLRALTAVLEKLKPRILINEHCYVSGRDRNATTDIIIGMIWPYCDDRSIDINDVIKYSLRLLDHEYLGFITRKLVSREIVPKYYTKINPMLLKLVQAGGFDKIHDVLTDLSDALVVL